jgi:type IVB pilus formation R64 PilN family outer membrane protein
MPLPTPLPATGVPAYPVTPLNVPGQPTLAAQPVPPAAGVAAPGAPAQATATPAPQPSSDAPAPLSPQQAYAQPLTDLSSIEMRWEGSLQGFLDHVTARLNLSWAYRDGVVVVERYMTETFELAAFVGAQDYKMALTGGTQGHAGAGGASGSSSSTLDLSESGKIAALDSLKRAIDSMVAPTGGSVVLSEGSGRLLVTTTRDVMSRVRDVVKAEDASLQRQAQIQIDVYSVIANDADERGVDWTVFYQSLSAAWGAAIKSPTTLTGTAAGATSINILSNVQGSGTSARFGGTQAVLNLLNQVGESVQHRPVSLIALNRQWARKTNLKVDGYVSETTPATASSAGSGAPGLKTSSITTGDKFMVQPAILDNGSIILKFGVSLTELLGLFDVTAGSGATLQKVQTPVTSGTDDQGTVRLRPGEAMVVTGLSRRLGSTDRRLLADGAPVGFGGSRKATVKREEFLIVVRAFEI